MDTKQLITGNPKEGFYPIVQDTVTVIELNKAVMSLASESSSEDIIAAFDSVEDFTTLLQNVRNTENIVNGVLVNDSILVGKIFCNIIASSTQETLYIDGVFTNQYFNITITNTDGTFSCVKNVVYLNREVGDKTNVLILSLENDLANGQKDSPVEAEVSTALKDAISTGKACVIKSVNSDILANLQQISDNVTIVMEQISRIGQTFVAVNTTITVNTATNVISDYQTGAIVLETEGDGNKFLSNDGKYKEIPQPDLSNYLAKNNTTEFTPTEDYQPATKKYVDDKKFNNVFRVNNSSNLLRIENYSTWTESIVIPKNLESGSTLFVINIANISTYDNLDNNILVTMRTAPGILGQSIDKIISDILGNKYHIEILIKYEDNQNDNDYYTATFTCTEFKPIQRVLTESEYSALGDTSDDDVLYFVTPD